MLFVVGTPGTSGWIPSQYLLAGLSRADLTFGNVNNSVTVNNATREVSFHLSTTVPELLWFQIIADPLGSSVVSWKWLEAHGPGLTWTPQGFVGYQKYGSLVHYIPYWPGDTVGFRAFLVDFVVPGLAVAVERETNRSPD